jgi:hypothetical protein
MPRNAQVQDDRREKMIASMCGLIHEADSRGNESLPEVLSELSVEGRIASSLIS